jgi:hypothetical protein
MKFLKIGTSGVQQEGDVETYSTSKYYVDGTVGNDSTADGSVNLPFKTIQACLNFIGQPISMADYMRHIIIYLSDSLTAGVGNNAGANQSWNAVYKENLVVPSRSITMIGNGVKIGNNVNAVDTGFGNILKEYSKSRAFSCSSADFRPTLTVIGAVNSWDNQQRLRNGFHIGGDVRTTILARNFDSIAGDGTNKITVHITTGQNPYSITIPTTYPSEPLIRIVVAGTTNYNATYDITAKISSDTFEATRVTGTNAATAVEVSGSFFESDSAGNPGCTHDSCFINCYMQGQYTTDDGTVNGGARTAGAETCFAVGSKFFTGIEGRNITIQKWESCSTTGTYIVSNISGMYNCAIGGTITVTTLTYGTEDMGFFNSRFTSAVVFSVNTAGRTVKMDAASYTSFLAAGCTWAVNTPTIGFLDQDLAIKNNSTAVGTTVKDALDSLAAAIGAGPAINQLTGDVTAGPGSGSQVATVAAIQTKTVSGTTGTTNVVFSASPTFTGTVIMPTRTGAASGGAVTTTGGTAAVSSAGGNASLVGAPGDSTGSGGAGGTVTLTGGAANGDNTANKAGGNITITAGSSKGSSGGGTVTVTSGVGGVGTGTAGASGGNSTVVAGVGGAGSATSGTGGTAALTGGAGGAGVAGANGGTATVTGGAGGAGSASGGNGGAVTISGGAAAAFAAAAGGAATVTGAAGTSTGSGGAGGNLTLTGGAANGDNTVDRAGGSVTINGGASKGSSGGGGFTVNLGAGGVGTGTAGATGGSANINGGTGGAGSATSGAGGNSTLKGGTGGAGVAGGAGGTATLSGGTGGAGSASGGNGGASNVSGGSAAAFAGAAGGAVSLAGGGGTSTGSGGAGGAATITGGAANGDNTVDRAGGNITGTCGNSKGSATGGTWTMNAGVGGVGTGTAGATGGAVNVNAGAGGVGSATGGAGGTITIKAGAGGASGTPGAGGNIIFSTGATTSVVEHFRVSNSGDTQTTNGNSQILTAGFGLGVKAGTNSKIGTAVLVAGTVTVATTAVTANSSIFLTSQVDGGTPGFLRITAKTAGTSFVITSSNGADTSTVAWIIVERL